MAKSEEILDNRGAIGPTSRIHNPQGEDYQKDRDTRAIAVTRIKAVKAMTRPSASEHILHDSFPMFRRCAPVMNSGSGDDDDGLRFYSALGRGVVSRGGTVMRGRGKVPVGLKPEQRLL